MAKYIVPFIVIGLPCVSLIVYSIYRFIRDRMRCTEPVEVICVEVKKVYKKNSNAYVYRPIWKFEFEGRIYYIRNDVASNFIIPQVGYTTTYYINPNNPQQFRHKTDWQFFAVVIPATLILVLMIVLI